MQGFGFCTQAKLDTQTQQRIKEFSSYKDSREEGPIWIGTAEVLERTQPELALPGEVREQQLIFALDYMKPGSHNVKNWKYWFRTLNSAR